MLACEWWLRQVVMSPTFLQAASADAQPAKLWGGRFTGKTDPLMEKFNESLPFDKRMWAEDIRVSPARADTISASGSMFTIPCCSTSSALSPHVPVASLAGARSTASSHHKLAAMGEKHVQAP